MSINWCYISLITLLISIVKCSALNNVSPNLTKECNETGWIVLPSGLCYKISSTKSSFFKARHNCQSQSAELATIREADWSTLFNKTLEGKIKSLWIGLTDYGLEGRYKWVSGEKINSKEFFFAEDKSHRVKNDDCVLVQTEYGGHETTAEKSWYPRACHNPAHYICMRGTTAQPLKHLTPTHGRCPDNYFRRGLFCYKIVNPIDVNTPKSWHDAQTACSKDSEESDLLSILDVRDQDYWTAYMGSARWGYWIGLRYRIHNPHHTDHYGWNHQHELTYTNFLNQQSNDTNLCVYLSNARDTAGSWLEERCSARLGYICETSLIPDNSTESNIEEPLLQRGVCSYPFYEWRGACYNVHSFRRNTSRPLAKQICQHVAIGTSVAERAFMRVLMRLEDPEVTAVWVGVTAKRNSSNKIVYESDNPESQHLIDAREFHLTNKLSNQDSDICFRMSLKEKDEFQQTSCSDLVTPLCYYYPEQRNFQKEAKLFGCESSWLQINSTCYKYFIKSELHTVAKMNCTKNGATLFYPTNHALEEYLSATILDNKTAWTSIRIREENGSSIFTSNEDVNITDFHFGPNGLQNVKDKRRCFSFNGSSGQITDRNCAKDSLPFVCQKKAHSTKLPECPTDSDFQVGSDCYRIIKPKKSWHDAQLSCRAWKEDASLASVQNKADNEKIWGNIRSKFEGAATNVWIGFSDVSVSQYQVWHWVDNREPTFSYFHQDFHLDNNGQELCVTMSSKDGRWNDTHCGMKYSSLCVYHRKPLIHLRQPPVVAGDKCPEGFFTFSPKKMCYKVVNDKQYSWHSANQYCQSLVDRQYNKRATLATVPSEEVNYLLYSLLATNSSLDMYWIGYHRQDDQLLTADGSQITYLRSENIQSCAAMKAGYVSGHFGEWVSRNCNDKKPIICQSTYLPKSVAHKGKGDANNNLLHKPNDIVCPRAWHTYENSISGKSCYYPLQYPNHYELGKRDCQSHLPPNFFPNVQSTLLTIESPYELSFVYSMYENWALTRDSPLILGLNAGNKSWYWDNAEPVSYTFWTDQPNKTTGCFAYYYKIAERRGYGMRPIPCNMEGNVVCKIKLPKAIKPKLLSFKEKPLECFENPNGTDFQGTISRTVGEEICIRWDLVKDPIAINQARQAFLSTWNRPLSWASNHCRNPSSMQHVAPFCYVRAGGPNSRAKIDLCKVSVCTNHLLNYHHLAKPINDGSHWVAFLFSSIFIIISLASLVGFFIWKRSATANGFIPYFRQGSRSGGSAGNGGTSFHNPIYTPANC